MGFRFQKRINFGNGFGANLSKSGISFSQRTKFGSFGTRGSTIRTGIKGLSYRTSRRRSDPALDLLLLPFIFGFWLIIEVIFFILRMITVLIIKGIAAVIKLLLVAGAISYYYLKNRRAAKEKTQES